MTADYDQFGRHRYFGVRGCIREVVRAAPHGGSATRFFQSDEPRGQSATTEEKLAGRNEPLRYLKVPGTFIAPGHSQKTLGVHERRGYRKVITSHECSRGTLARNYGQTARVIDPHFVYLAALLSLVGAYGYLASTLRGTTSPHRVTWSLWGLEGVLAFVVEVQQRVGLASLMTLMLGLVPLLIVAASFRNSRNAWRITRFDIGCGLVSLLGIAFWALVHEPTVALVSFVVADQIAAVPTLRKSWLAPASESSGVFFMGVLNTGITLLTLRHFTTVGALFPGTIFIADLVVALLVFARLGPRFRGETTRLHERIA